MKQLLLSTASTFFLVLYTFGQANTRLSNLVSPTAVNQSLLPNSTNIRDLGSSSYRWRNLFLGGYVYLDGNRFISNAPGTGNYNTLLGSYAGIGMTSGFNNTAVGHNALYKTTSGYANSAIGAFSLYHNTSGFSNIAIGARSLYTNTEGYWNIALGDSALYNNTIGYFNAVAGAMALYSNTIGNSNTAFGNFALYTNTTGTNNNAIGISALFNNTSGYINNAIGDFALYNNTTGTGNTALGQDALFGNTITNYNTGVGFDAGIYYTSQGTFLGAESGSISDLTNVTAVGYNAFVDVSNKVRIGNTEVTSIGGQVNWTTFSDARYKQNIKEDVHGLDFINSLRPITYTVDIQGLNAFYNKSKKQLKEAKPAIEEGKAEAEASGIVHNGFVAQEVEKAAQKLNYNFSGVDKPKSQSGLYGLRYSDFVVPLVKAVQELSKENEELKKKADKVDELEIRLQKIEALLNNNTSVISLSGYLEQNRPNPTNGTTTINYHLPQNVLSAHLNLTNAQGQVLRTITITNSGSGQLRLNTASLPSGTYTYILYVDGKQADTKRLIVAR